MKIYYSSPFNTQKNIGKAYNDFIELLPNDAWVCITDGDALWLRPDWGSCIEKVITDNPNYDLIGCQTNRLGILKLCHENRFNEDTDAYNHYPIANDLWDKYGTQIEPIDLVAGVCMIFRKKTWLKVGKFKEDTIIADRLFSKAVLINNGKIGIAKGLYIFHSYRIWEKTHLKAWQSVKHLK